MSDAWCNYGDDYLTTAAPCTALLPQVSITSVAHIIHIKFWNNDHPLTLSAQIHTLYTCRLEDCTDTLREIGELASEADDLRAQAVYDCCHFDALLDAGKS